MAESAEQVMWPCGHPECTLMHSAWRLPKPSFDLTFETYVADPDHPLGGYMAPAGRTIRRYVNLNKERYRVFRLGCEDGALETEPIMWEYR